MNSLSNYDNIEIGDVITLPNSSLVIKSGTISSIRKWNGHALRVECSNGATFELSRHKRNFVISVA